VKRVGGDFGEELRRQRMAAGLSCVIWPRSFTTAAGTRAKSRPARCRSAQSWHGLMMPRCRRRRAGCGGRAGAPGRTARVGQRPVRTGREAQSLSGQPRGTGVGPFRELFGQCRQLGLRMTCSAARRTCPLTRPAAERACAQRTAPSRRLVHARPDPRGGARGHPGQVLGIRDSAGRCRAWRSGTGLTYAGGQGYRRAWRGWTCQQGRALH